MNEFQLEVVLDRIDKIQSTVDRIDRDLTTDREDIQRFTIKLTTMESQMEEFRKSLGVFETKVKDKIDDALQPMIDETKDLKEAIDEKQLTTLTKTKHWWQFWKSN